METEHPSPPLLILTNGFEPSEFPPRHTCLLLNVDIIGYFSVFLGEA